MPILALWTLGNNKNEMAATASLPSDWAPFLQGYSFEAQAIGKSRADVHRLHAQSRPDLFVKTEISDDFTELGDEIARLEWLCTQNIPSPQVLRTATENGRVWLLMSALEGQDMTRSTDLPASDAIHIFAAALRVLHNLPIENCPFDHRLEHRIALAQKRMHGHQVDEDDFGASRKGKSAEELFLALQAQRPDIEDLVVTHGDASLPNFIVSGGTFSGFIDCGRLGVADRHQDLGIACSTIIKNFGADWIEPFFAAYGFPPNNEKLAYYQLLDEFF